MSGMGRPPFLWNNMGFTDVALLGGITQACSPPLAGRPPRPREPDSVAVGSWTRARANRFVLAPAPLPPGLATVPNARGYANARLLGNNSLRAWMRKDSRSHFVISIHPAKRSFCSKL